MAKKGILAVSMCLGLALISLLSSCVSTDVAGPVADGISYGAHVESSLVKYDANLQKVSVNDIEDISGNLKAISSFTAVSIEGDWVIGNYIASKFLGSIKYQKAAKVKKDLYRDPQSAGAVTEE